MDRSHNRSVVFHDDEDRQQCLTLLGRYQQRFRFRLYHYCLMANHFHLLVQLQDPRHLSPLMAGLLRAYVHHCHRRHGFVGHLWQGRFKSPAIQRQVPVELWPLYRTQPRGSGIARATLAVPVVEQSGLCARHGGPIVSGEPLLPGNGRRGELAAAIVAEFFAWRRRACKGGEPWRLGGGRG